MPEEKVVHGGCLCGAIRFEVTLPVRFCVHCHCSMCRRAHGAPLVTWTGVPDPQFRLVAGAESLREHASSAEATRSFCSVCGSMLLFRSIRWPGEVHVATASFDGEIDRQPTAHIFWSDRVAWLDCSDALPKCGGPTGLEPLA